MNTLYSVDQIELKPLEGKTYFNLTREWREEFIYFLMVDRFHDDEERRPDRQPGRSRGVKTPEGFYGGKIKGITQNLDYIAGLGCTAIWLSPVLANNQDAYHGYNICNYLDVDPHFGTKQDLIDLVEAAHHYRKDGRDYPIRIIMDVVINHSGDNWAYPEGANYEYDNARQFPLGFWRNGERSIIPVELQKDCYYHRHGNIRNWDNYPENQLGDLSGLKDYANDDDPAGAELVDILIKTHCYWIRETDIDGFRVDAVKHMGELACSRFCSGIREFAYSIGKKGFFLFGELATPNDEVINRYIGQNTSRVDRNTTVFFGLNSILDFRLALGTSADEPGLRSVLKGFGGPETLYSRYESQRLRALSHGELGRFLVTFVDNHDSFWQPGGRFGAQAPQEQIIAAIGYLLCSLGTACIYYGTEQGFEGQGGDNAIREAMFDRDRPGFNLLNPDCVIYKEIAAIAAIVRSKDVMRFGRMYFREISGDGIHFGLPFGTAYTLAFSRFLWGAPEVLVAYNVSTESRRDCVIIDGETHKSGGQMTYLYGKTGTVPIQKNVDDTYYVHLELGPRQFVILE